MGFLSLTIRRLKSDTVVATKSPETLILANSSSLELRSAPLCFPAANSETSTTHLIFLFFTHASRLRSKTCCHPISPFYFPLLRTRASTRSRYLNRHSIVASLSWAHPPSTLPPEPALPSSTVVIVLIESDPAAPRPCLVRLATFGRHDGPASDRQRDGLLRMSHSPTTYRRVSSDPSVVTLPHT